ncbi:MAG TPA: A24 family peptidase [Candidatus Limnocylindria bacterium]|nr:A24 family peptidase [Candidatus Limnocylindria bacterium]
MTAIALAAGIGFAIIGAAAERIASVWPPDEASRRAPGWRTALFAIASGASAWAIVGRSTLPPWATAVHLVVLALLVLMSATDFEQRRLPHLLLDPLIAICAVFAFVNPTLSLVDAAIGAAAAVALLGALGLVVRSGVALGDLYLVAPLGLLLGWPAIFVAIFIAALLLSASSLVMLVSRRVGLKSYVPFGPFLVAGTVITLLRDDNLLGEPAAAAATLLGHLLGRMY